MVFTRKLKEKDIEALKSEKLFNDHLLEDCNKGDVFPAVRNNSVDFYHKGGRLFSWTPSKGFVTHCKYVPFVYKNCQYNISEKELVKVDVPKDFCAAYGRIKELCSLYSGVEAQGVSQLYSKFSCATGKSGQKVFVIDIEVAFAGSESGKAKQDRMDMVVLDKSTRKLRFFEAKHYSNSALRSEIVPDLHNQINRYDVHLNEKKTEIISAYKSHIRAINNLFNVHIPEPDDIDAITKVVIFGFDEQQKAYLKDSILKNDELKKRTYALGNIKSADLATMFRGGKQNWE